MANNSYEWHGFGKFWLWFCFIVNIIGLVVNLVGLVFSAALGGKATVGISFVAEIVILAGIYLLLFKKQKKGFYLIVVAAIINLIVNIVGGQIVGGIIICIISLGIMYFAIRKGLPYLD